MIVQPCTELCMFSKDVLRMCYGCFLPDIFSTADSNDRIETYEILWVGYSKNKEREKMVHTIISQWSKASKWEMLGVCAYEFIGVLLRRRVGVARLSAASDSKTSTA